ncbi:MAG: MaoC family dehydratase [SAR324 cluster bacterium]|nr:MaoC family dehydratase [SAR324 cluster bacterium]
MSKKIDFETLKIGDSIPELVKEPITRTQLALFAGASGDHNPIHLDDAEAQAGGLDGVIAHGMLNMAFLGQVLTEWLPQRAVRSFSTRFAAMAYPGDVITCKGVVSGKVKEKGENLLELDLLAENQNGEILLKGNATVAVKS